MDTEKFVKLVLDQLSSILLIVLGLTFLTISFSYFVEEKFESESTYKIRNNSPFPDNQLGFLSGIASFDNAGNSVDIVEVEEIASSFEFTDKFITNYDLELHLINQNNTKSKYPKRIDYYKKFHNNLTIVVKGDYLTMSYADSKPEKAKEILENWANELDEFFRVRENSRSQKALEYLSNALSERTFVSLNESLSAYAERELNNLVMTQVESQYLLTIIDSPNLPEYKKYPQRIIWLIISILILNFNSFYNYIVELKTSKKLNFLVS